MKASHWLIFAAACAACCAPILLPLAGSIGLAGLAAGAAAWFAGMGAEAIACLAILSGFLVFAAIWALRAHARRRAAAACAIGGPCDPNARG